MKIQVTFVTPVSKYVPKSFEIVEIYDLIPHANGFVPDYQLRASALGWIVKEVVEIE